MCESPVLNFFKIFGKYEIFVKFVCSLSVHSPFCDWISVNGISWMFSNGVFWYIKGVSGFIQVYLESDLRVLQRYFNGTSKVLKGYFKGVS